MKIFKCPNCDGDGKEEIDSWQETYTVRLGVYEDCRYCDRTGRISLWRRLTYWWGTGK